jgi:hypothetical protein
VAECAIMISQLDPMIAACRFDCYQEKEENITMAKMITRKRYQEFMVGTIVSEEKETLAKSEEKIKNHRLFECPNCKKVITNEQPKNILSNQNNSLICYKCILKQDNPEKFLKPLLQKQLQPLAEHRLLNYMKLKDI